MATAFFSPIFIYTIFLLFKNLLYFKFKELFTICVVISRNQRSPYCFHRVNATPRIFYLRSRFFAAKMIEFVSIGDSMFSVSRHYWCYPESDFPSSYSNISKIWNQKVSNNVRIASERATRSCLKRKNWWKVSRCHVLKELTEKFLPN